MLTNLLKSPLSWLLLALAVTLGGWGWSASAAATAKGKVATLQTDLKAQQEAAEQAAQLAATEATARNATITTLQGELAAQLQDAAALSGQLDTLAQTAATRANTIKRLTRENEELRAWADRPLPAPVIRLLQRPALTGAADYQAQLSGADPLPAAASQPGQ